MIKTWQDLLDSLSTAGGNIVTLFWCSAFSAGLWLWTVRHGDPQMSTACFGVFTGFTGALLQAQKGNSSKQQMADRVDPLGTGVTATAPKPPAQTIP